MYFWTKESKYSYFGYCKKGILVHVDMLCNYPIVNGGHR